MVDTYIKKVFITTYVIALLQFLRVVALVAHRSFSVFYRLDLTELQKTQMSKINKKRTIIINSTIKSKDSL